MLALLVFLILLILAVIFYSQKESYMKDGTQVIPNPLPAYYIP